MTYLNTKFNMLGFNDSLVIATKPKAKYRDHAATIFMLQYTKELP
jgi:hypothetical protein